jgi:predicted transcriptional regulator
MEKTTIQLSNFTLERLKALKKMERQSYDHLLNDLIDSYEEESLSSKEIEDIQEGLEDLKQGRIYSIEEIAKEFGVKLN